LGKQKFTLGCYANLYFFGLFAKSFQAIYKLLSNSGPLVLPSLWLTFAAISMRLLFLLFGLLFFASVAFGQQRWAILGTSAPKDPALFTKKLQSLIDQSADSAITIMIKGRHKMLPIRLKSKTTIILDKSCYLSAPTTAMAYPLLQFHNRYSLPAKGIRALFYAYEVDRISITGKGTIDGMGTSAAFAPNPDSARPYIIALIGCTNILIDGISLRQPAYWTQAYFACTKIKIRNQKVYAHANRNNDGLDIVGCKNVVISRCKIDSDDDAIVLKTFTPAFPNQNITVSGCLLRSNCNAFKVGTETAGDCHNVTFKNSIISGSSTFSNIYARRMGLTGICLASVDGGTLSSVLCHNISIKDVYAPFFIRCGQRGRAYVANADSIRDRGLSLSSISEITLRAIKGTSSRGPECIISGIPGQPIRNLLLENIILSMPGGYPDSLPIPSAPPEVTEGYPEIKMFGQYSPASGIYIRHVDGFRKSGITIIHRRKDRRPKLVQEP